ncbi:MAG: hypothetical protein QOJ62_1046, partial [Actinomycetota bacterium]|nr:hypothetical protein [Actinomycetota bacterium]
MWSIAPKLLAMTTTVTAVALWTMPAQAAPLPLLSCGETVTGPVVLTHDLHCHGDGVVLLGGSLNLHRHTISGDGTGLGVAVAASAGAAVDAAVTSGTITGFATGIAHVGSDDLTLRLSNLAIHDTTAAAISSQPNTTEALDHVVVTDNVGLGIDETLGGHAVVSHSTINHNGSGVVVDSDGSIDLVRTAIRHNDVAISCSQGRVGLNHSEVTQNGSGISMFQCEGSVLANSRFIGNGMAASEETLGFSDIADPTLVIRNDVFQGNGTGLHLTPFAMTTVVRDSVFRANGAGIVMDACNVGET